MRIHIRDEDGREDVLRLPLSDLPSSREGVLDQDLSKFSGRMVELCFALEATEVPTSEIEWRDLRLEGLEARMEVVESDTAPLRGHYNVLLVLWDSLRSDRTEPYGSKEVQTPEISRLAAERGLALVPVFSRFADERGAIRGELSYDNLHLSGRGYREWQSALAEHLQR